MGSVGPTHRTDADSDPREYIPTADSPFYCFSTPVTLVVSPVFPRCTGVCVFVPCGILRAPCPSEWSRELSAPSSVARVCLLTPPYTRTTLCRLSLLHHRRRWVSLTYHAILVWGPRFGVSLRLQMQGGSRRLVGPQRLRLLLPLLQLSPNHTSHMVPSSPRTSQLPGFARLVVILLHRYIPVPSLKRQIRCLKKGALPIGFASRPHPNGRLLA